MDIVLCGYVTISIFVTSHDACAMLPHHRYCSGEQVVLLNSYLIGCFIFLDPYYNQFLGVVLILEVTMASISIYGLLMDHLCILYMTLGFSVFACSIASRDGVTIVFLTQFAFLVALIIHIWLVRQNSKRASNTRGADFRLIENNLS